MSRAGVHDRVDNVRVLLARARGADPNAESGTGEEGLPLCGAAWRGHVEPVRELLAAGADPDLREDNGSGRLGTAVEIAMVGSGPRLNVAGLLQQPGETSVTI